MYENEFRRSTSSRRPSKKPEKKSKGPGVIGVQTVLCMICILFAFIVKFMGGSAYAYMKSFAETIVSENITAKDVDQVLNNIKKNLPDVVSVYNDLNGMGGVSGESSEEITSGTSEDTYETSSGDDAGAASGLSASDTSLTGEGGTELNAPGSAANASTLAAPKNVTLAPVMLTVKPAYPVKGRITSKFGYRISPITGKLSFHAGIDIAAAEGTAIKAALPGTVEKVGKSDSAGNYITLDNGGGVETVYCHCSKIVASVGDTVKMGDVIAKVGSTGNATGPHVHFEIRVNGIYINPLAQLEA